jgi:SAM-dependent methyltransferase
MLKKLRFFTRIMWHRLERQPRVCPFCQQATALRQMSRKKFVLDVFRCANCHLIFRWPLETEREANEYYQYAYAKSAPYVRFPSPAELNELLGNNFERSPLDRSLEIQIVKSLRPYGRVLDYGCSWGFATHQFLQYGFQASGFEISRVRAAYGRQKLHVQISDDFRELKSLPGGSFEIIYSHQVLKNLTDIRAALEVMRHLLVPGGLMFHVVPNFAAKLMNGGGQWNWIGEEHPIAPTAEFFEIALPRLGFTDLRTISSPFAEKFGFPSSRYDNGEERDADLLVLATKA